MLQVRNQNYCVTPATNSIAAACTKFASSNIAFRDRLVFFVPPCSARNDTSHRYLRAMRLQKFSLVNASCPTMHDSLRKTSYQGLNFPMAAQAPLMTVRMRMSCQRI